MNENTSIASTEYGLVEGIVSPLATRFLGIPYAKPPLGDLRFRHPVKPDPWNEILSCDRARDNALQAPAKFQYRKNVSQDCLYLNVYVPNGIEGKLPTMVWIHGGAYESGGVGASDDKRTAAHYDMSIFAAETKTVVVTLGYRMNLEGFMNLHSLSDRFDSNNGLYDIKMALEFVRDNIASFGGDPDNVTLFGESAGGALTLAMLSSDLTFSLFHRAIVQSACVDHFWSQKESKKIAKELLHNLSLKNPEDLLSLPWGRIQEGMRRIPWKLQRHGKITSPYSPVIDGVFLKKAPKEGVIARKHPMLIGTITHEGDLFTLDLSDFILHLMTVLTPAKARKENAPFRMRAADGITDFVFLKPSEWIGERYEGECYMYELDCPTPEMKEMGARSFHSADLMPLFHMTLDFGKADDPDVEIVGKYMRRIWSNFAYGKPIGEAYSKRKKKIIIDPQTARSALK